MILKGANGPDTRLCKEMVAGPNFVVQFGSKASDRVDTSNVFACSFGALLLCNGEALMDEAIQEPG